MHILPNERREKMPLIVAPIGRELKIVRILTDEKTKKHLESLGITLSSTVRIISQSGGSPVCMIKDGRLALDRNLAAKILVA